MTDTYYWCAAEDFGEQTTLDKGGFYEKIDEQVELPVQLDVGGYAKSNHPEVCMSKSPEACLFALAHNVNTATPLNVYRTDAEPDFDISLAGMDFGVLEEVRYRNPSENPIQIHRHTTVELPQRAFEDASESYNPYGPYQEAPERDMWDGRPVFHHLWAKEVKKSISEVLEGGEYPQTIEWESPYSNWPNSRDSV